MIDKTILSSYYAPILQDPFIHPFESNFLVMYLYVIERQPIGPKECSLFLEGYYVNPEVPELKMESS